VLNNLTFSSSVAGVRAPLSVAPAGNSTSASPHAPGQASVRLLRGLKSILKLQPQLAALARSSGQTGEADSLLYLLSKPAYLFRIPHLLLIHNLDSSGPSLSRLSAAMLLFEYKLPFGTRIFASVDPTGRRSVLAPPELRARVAVIAARSLVARGAHLVRITFSEVHRDSDEFRHPVSGALSEANSRNAATALPAIVNELRVIPDRPLPAAQWSMRESEHPAYLPLLPTFDATLARIGQKTRANLRYYRRRCEKEQGCTFVPNARLTRQEFLAFNRQCAYPVSGYLAVCRYRALYTHPHQHVHGVRDAQGRWLSLVGIRRQNGFVELDWQMNRAGMPNSSLSTVLRSYLIDHEIALGSTRLYIEGGTEHPIVLSFLKQRVSDLTVKRDSAYIRLLERFAPYFLTPRSYIRETLKNTGFQWHPW
jgi:hypothetical protein